MIEDVSCAEVPRPKSSCPPESVWMQLAVGQDASTAYLQHAAACPLCSSQLKVAVELTRDQMTSDESMILSKLDITQEERARHLASRMTQSSKRTSKR